jgi:hypothetical protein
VSGKGSTALGSQTLAALVNQADQPGAQHHFVCTARLMLLLLLHPTCNGKPNFDTAPPVDSAAMEPSPTYMEHQRAVAAKGVINGASCCLFEGH